MLGVLFDNNGHKYADNERVGLCEKFEKVRKITEDDHQNGDRSADRV